MRFVSFCVGLAIFCGVAQAAPRVITSILPVQSIVASVMGDTGTPTLLFSGQSSEHSATLTPQQLADLGHADAVFMIGAGLERKLQSISGSAAVGGKTFNELATAPGVITLQNRQGGNFAAHSHAHEGEGEDEHNDEHTAEAVRPSQAHDNAIASPFNPHIWLDPENAKAMTRAVAATLSAIDPGQAKTYNANAQSYIARLDRLATTIAKATAPVQARPFIVFHDAYPYYEARFHLNNAGSIADVTATTPTAQRLADVRQTITASHAVCVFREPQFNNRYVALVTEGTTVKTGVLDAVGYDVPPGPAAYEEMMMKLTTSLVACLSP